MAVVADGTGGWFIGGNFTSVGGMTQAQPGTRRADGTLDPAWNPSTDGVVFAASSRRCTWVARSTASAARRAHGIAALDAPTGMATSWNPIGGGFVSRSRSSARPSTPAGSISSIGGKARRRIAALDTRTGRATAWNPDVEELCKRAGDFWVDRVRQQVLEQVERSEAQQHRCGRCADRQGDGLESRCKQQRVGAGCLQLNGLRRRGLSEHRRKGTRRVRGAWCTREPARWLPSKSKRKCVCAGDLGLDPLRRRGLRPHRRRAPHQDARAQYPDREGDLLEPGCGGLVSAVAVSGSTVFAGGSFTTSVGESAATTSPHSMRRRGRPSGTRTRAITWRRWSGTTVYVGGHFASVAGKLAELHRGPRCGNRQGDHLESERGLPSARPRGV